MRSGATPPNCESQYFRELYEHAIWRSGMLSGTLGAHSQSTAAGFIDFLSESLSYTACISHLNERGSNVHFPYFGDGSLGIGMTPTFVNFISRKTSMTRSNSE